MNPVHHTGTQVLISLAIRGVVCVAMFCVSGCGGGTTGTGGTGSEFSGKIADDSGAPIANAHISLQETGDDATTDADGRFDIQTELEAAAITLIVQTGTDDSTVHVDEIPAGPQKVDVTLELNRKDKSIKVTAVHISPRATPTPLPIATAAPSPTATDAVPTPTIPPSSTVPPSSTETAIPTATPTQIPVPTPVATNTPTPSATVSPILRTLFFGKIVSSDPALIANAKVGVAGQGVRNVDADGTFSFRELASDGNNQLVVRSGGDGDQASIAGVTALAHRVKLLLRIETSARGKLELTVEFVKVTDSDTDE